jgi:hypothetical protein
MPKRHDPVTEKEMTVTTAQWIEFIRPIVEDLANPEVQRQSWTVGQGYSPEDLICGLMNDFSFSEHVRSPVVQITDEQRASGMTLVEAMDAFVDKVHGRFDWRAMLTDPDWRKVQMAAADFSKLLPP